MIFAFLIQASGSSSASDSLAASIPPFSQRFNLTLPLIIVLFILMFFLLLKSYTQESETSTMGRSSDGSSLSEQKNIEEPERKR